MRSPPMPDPAPGLGSRSEPSWHEYPLGVRGQFATSAVNVLLPFLVGLLVTFALVLAAGIAAEEDLLDSPLLARSLDQLTRFSLASMIVLAWGGDLLRRVALGTRDVAVSRAIGAAAAARAPRQLVPHPSQVETVTTKPWQAFSTWSLAHVVVVGLFAALWLVYLMFDPFVVGWWILLGLGAVAGIHALAIGAIRSRAAPAHRARHQEIGAWWTPHDEQAAWDRARAADQSDSRAEAVPRSRRLTIGNLVIQGSAALLTASFTLMYLVLVVTHPDAERWAGGQLGRRAQLDPATEHLVDLGVWTFAGGMVLGLLLGILGTLVEGSALSRERRHLQAAVGQPGAARPVSQVLARHTRDLAPHWAQAMAVAAAACLSLGLSGVTLGTVPLEEFGDGYAGAEDVFADRLPFFGALTAVGGLLLLIALVGAFLAQRRHRDLRRALIARWPVLPEVEQGDDAKPPPLARVGPALSAPPGTDAQ